MKKWFVYIFSLYAIVLLLAPLPTFAKSYYYDSITIDARVNKDATVDVTEEITYHFSGSFHNAWREIPMNGIREITDIAVYNASGTKIMSRSACQEPLRVCKILWQYNPPDVSEQSSWERTFLLKYKLHGVLRPYYNKGIDELYLNLFTDYPEKVLHVSGTLYLPEHKGITFSGGDIKYTFYASPEMPVHASYVTVNNDIVGLTYRFGESFPPQGKATIAISWPQGYVDMPTQREYWLGVLRDYYGALVALGASVLIGLIWLITEYLPMKRKTIIPRYTPPHGHSPAIMDIIVHEGITKRTLPAMIVDLAVRGYWKIEEKYENNFIIKVIALVVILFIVLNGLIKIVPTLIAYIKFLLDGVPVIWHIFYMPLLLFVLYYLYNLIRYGHELFFDNKYYVVKINENTNTQLSDIEKAVVDFLMRYGQFKKKHIESKEWSTRILGLKTKHNTNNIHEDYKKLRKELLSLAGVDDVFTPSLRMERIITRAFYILIIVAGLFFTIRYQSINSALIAISALAVLRAMLDARLTARGRNLKAEYLGFKMYLETAEKYRMQNLTPELFEKYLPYAMIFKVEDKWARAFELAGVSLGVPSFYTNGGNYRHIGAGGVFSPSAFSSALSASIGSAMASASGGASGGGGFAGGGVGGGGGGAS